MSDNLRKNSRARLKTYTNSMKNLGEKISHSLDSFKVITQTKNDWMGNATENTVTGAKCTVYLIAPKSPLDKLLVRENNVEYELVLNLKYDNNKDSLEPTSLEAISHDPINGPNIKRKIDEIISQERTFSRIYKKD